MLVVLSDTHGRDSVRLEGRTDAVVDAAELVVHAGDFTTTTVLDAFEERCELRAVAGNNDQPAVRERIDDEALVEWAGLRIVVVHGHEHSETAMSMLGRQANADLVVVGHSHRPAFGDGVVPNLNPGSHAQPRRYRASHAELEWDDDVGRAAGRLVTPGGDVFEQFSVEPQSDGD